MQTRTFTTKANLNSAIRKQGFQNIPHRVLNREQGKVTAEFTCELPEDVEYVRSKGFPAVLAK